MLGISLSGCSGAGKDLHGQGSVVAVTADDSVRLARHGEDDARQALAAENARECEARLLKIRANETRMRQAGYPHCADIYISSARKALDMPRSTGH